MPVVFYDDEAGEHRWRVEGENGEPVCHGEGHTREGDAIRAFVRAVDLMQEALEAWKASA